MYRRKVSDDTHTAVACAQLKAKAHGASSEALLGLLHKPPRHLADTFYESLCAYSELRVQMRTLRSILPHRPSTISCLPCWYDKVSAVLVNALRLTLFCSCAGTREGGDCDG